MGGAASTASGSSSWTTRDYHSLKDVQNLCSSLNIDCDQFGIKGFFEDNMQKDTKRITRMQLAWGAEQFKKEGPEKAQYIRNAQKTMAGAAEIAFAAAAAAQKIAASVQGAERAALKERRRQEAQVAAKYAQESAVQARELCKNVKSLIDGIVQPKIDEYWNTFLSSLFQVLQNLAEEKLGGTCSDVKFDLTSKTPALQLLSPLRFEGGTADVITSDLTVLDQISKAIKALYDSIDEVNDILEKRSQPRSFEMLHLRFEVQRYHHCACLL